MNDDFNQLMKVLIMRFDDFFAVAPTPDDKFIENISNHSKVITLFGNLGVKNARPTTSTNESLRELYWGSQNHYL